MIRGLYTAATGLALQWERQEAIANNLANVGTTGYKRDQALSIQSFNEHLLYAVTGNQRQPVGTVGHGVAGTVTLTDFTAGIFEETGNPLDLAIEGEGFLVVETAQGERLTRNGSLTRDGQGFLVTSQGQHVLGDNGPIVLVGANVEIRPNGEVVSEGVVVDRLRIVKPEANAPLIKEGVNLFRTEGAWVPVENCRVHQGVLERSNVNAVLEMVRMIEVSRSYEAAQRVLAIHETALEKAVGEVGRV